MRSEDLWIFGYGSLIWDPGFPVAEQVIGRVHGYHRSFCMRSIHHRGTVETPGLVLALDKSSDDWCDGVAFRVARGEEEKTLDYLRERELISSAYLEVQLNVDLQSGDQVRTTSFIIDADHDQYCGGLSLDEQARIISHSIGGRGPNWEYLYNTAQHLEELGLSDPDLNWLCGEVAAIRAQID